jgi:hypothetical protein
LQAGPRYQWERLVQAYPFDFFNPGDQPLLLAYAQMSDALERAAFAKDTDTVERLSKSLSSLCIRLRCAPSARADRERAGKAMRTAADKNPKGGTWRDRIGEGGDTVLN